LGGRSSETSYIHWMQEQVKSLHSMNVRTGKKFTFNECKNR